MPREPKLFNASKGSPSRGFLRLAGNLPPSWIDRAITSRKALEPGVLNAIRKLKRLRVKRPNARVTIKAAEGELRAALREWETAYQKECFYYGIRVLLELERGGSTRL
jgi:hypothetical protein